MDKNRSRRIIIALLIVSICIYGLQIFIFHDERNTFFYIMQDFAFLPLTIAITTVVIGRLIETREKKERIAKLRMITASFFTEGGARLMNGLLAHSSTSQDVTALIDDCTSDEETVRQKIRSTKVQVHLDGPFYRKVMDHLTSSRTDLAILASNPMLLDDDAFSEMLWGIFHILDEYRLRGEWEDLSEADISHLEEDLPKVLKLLLENWNANSRYVRKTFPNFYSTASARVKQIRKNKQDTL